MTADASRRLYGPVVLGGVLGGAVGSTALATAIGILPPAAWLAIATAGAIGIGVVARRAGAAAAQWRARANGPDPEAPPEATLEGSSALEGFRTVLGSRYLLSIAAIVCLYEIISTLADFQFTETVAHNLDGSQIRSHVSTVYFISNALSATVQLLAAGAILSRFGVGRALIVLPIALAAVSMSFLAMPILWIASALSVVDNGLNYSLHQSARESLYVVADRAAKYRAKAFVDVFLMRVAKMTAVGIVLALSTLLATFDEVRWLSLLVLAFVVLWLLSALAAGRRYDALAAERHVDKTV